MTAPASLLDSAPTLGTETRAMLSQLVRRPGHTLSAEELCAGLPVSALTPRRVADRIEEMRAAVGTDAIETVPRRGWRFLP